MINAPRNNDIINTAVKWRKFSCDIAYWFGVMLVSELVYRVYYAAQSCQKAQSELLAIVSSGNSPLEDITQTICAMEGQIHSWAYTFLALTILRVLFLFKAKNGLIMKYLGLTLVKANKQISNGLQYALYGIIEWLPTLVGATYILAGNAPTTISSTSAHTTMIIGAQLIWLAPVLFRINGKNMPELLTGITVQASERYQNTIEQGVPRRAAPILCTVIYGLFTGFFILSFIQILRIPPLNPAYQDTIYGGYTPTWEGNIYFAMEGLSAPENTPDFYQYGLKKAYDNAKLYEEMKEKGGIDARYLYSLPLSTNSVSLEPEQEINLISKNWKNLSCLYEVAPETPENCASFSDLHNYIAQSRLIWDRYNKVPTLGNAYVTPPQLLGSKFRNLIQLAELKASDIIDKATQGQTALAMQQWLAYMSLYRSMANDRETMVFKAVLSVSINIHMHSLQKLLSIAPDLSAQYKQELLEALRSDVPIFRDQHMMADDWGLIEPALLSAVGNANAARNDFFECLQGFEALGKIPHNKYPYSSAHALKLCPLHEDKTMFEMVVVYPFSTSGNFITNTIYRLIFGGLLKGHDLIETMKIQHVKFRQAELAITMIASGIKTQADVEAALKNAPTELKNPINEQPFLWDAEAHAIFFEHPISKRKFRFHLPRQ